MVPTITMEHVLPASDIHPAMSTTTIADYFGNDSKPTFVVDITKHESDGFPPAIIYINDALRAFEPFLELFASIESSAVREAFNNWVFHQTSTSVIFADCIWSGSMIRDDLRVISGIFMPNQPQSLQSGGRTDHVLDRSTTGDASSINPNEDSPVSNQHLDRPLLRIFPEPQTPHVRLIQDHDWANSAFGPTNTWIASLRHQVQFMSSNPLPGAVFWGPERLIIYNEAFHPLIGAWHPNLMGKSLKIEWSAFWAHYERICEEVEATKGAVSLVAADGPLFVRHGCLQETFFTFDYIPLFDSSGNVAGVYDQAMDVTNDMYAQGRMSILQRTSDIATTAKTQTDLWNTTLEILKDAKKDLPIVTMYTVGNDTSLADIATQVDHIEDVVTWISKGSAGYSEAHLTTDVSDVAKLDGLTRMIQQSLSNVGPTLFTINDNEVARKLLADCEYKGYPYDTIIVCPLRLASGAAVGCMIIGLNPLRPYDEDYQHFIQLMILQIENALKLVVFIEAQARLLQETVDQAAIEQQLLSEQLKEQTRKAQESALRFLKFAEQAPVSKIYSLCTLSQCITITRSACLY